MLLRRQSPPTDSRHSLRGNGPLKAALSLKHLQGKRRPSVSPTCLSLRIGISRGRAWESMFITRTWLILTIRQVRETLGIKTVFLKVMDTCLRSTWGIYETMCRSPGLNPEPENQNSKRLGAWSLESEFLKKVSRWFWCALQLESHGNSMVAKSMGSGIIMSGFENVFPHSPTVGP